MCFVVVIEYNRRQDVTPVVLLCQDVLWPSNVGLTVSATLLFVALPSVVLQDLPNLPEWELLIREDGSVDRRRYNAPTAGEVAGFMPGGWRFCDSEGCLQS
jgi:hypothetical protein